MYITCTSTNLEKKKLFCAFVDF